MKLFRIASATTGFLRTPTGQEVGRTAIDRVSGIADRATGNRHAERISKARDVADRQLRKLGPDGGQSSTPPATPPHP